eukprot:scaffold46829_cov16-Tisochrysis_lutea.AAC.1
MKNTACLALQDSLALADEVIQGQRQVEDKDGTLTFYTYDIVSPQPTFKTRLFLEGSGLD